HWLASASWDATVKVWDVLGKREPTLRYTLRGHRGHVIGVAFSFDNRTLASASWDNTVRLWDLEAPEGDALSERFPSIPLTRGVFSIGFSPDGLLVIGQANGIAIYDPATGK